MTTMTTMDSLDGQRRAGWARAYAATDALAYYAGVVRELDLALTLHRHDDARRLTALLEPAIMRALLDVENTPSLPARLEQPWQDGRNGARHILDRRPGVNE